MKNRGTAIITALFIMALVVIAATTIALRLELNITHTELSVNAHKMILARMSAQAWATEQLSQLVNDTKTIATPRASIQLSPYSQDGITVNAELIDAQQFFNINILQRTPTNLNDAERDPILLGFARLIRSINDNMSDSKAFSLSYSMANRVHQSNPYADKIPGVLKRLSNIKFVENLQQEMNRRTTRNYSSLYHPLMSLSEIRNTPGMNQEIYNQVKPTLVALPSLTPINLNTAPASVLLLLSDRLDQETAKRLVQERDNAEPLESTGALFLLPTAKGLGLKEPLSLPTTVRSQFFLLNTKLSTERQRQSWQTLLHIRRVNNKAKVTVLMQQLNYD